MSELQKKCNGCGLEKPHSAFVRRKPGSGCRFNLASRCKECRNKSNLKWHFDNHARSTSNHRKWTKKNASHVSEYARKRRESDPEPYSKKYSEFVSANLPYFRAKQAIRSSRVKTSTPKWISFIQLAKIREFHEIAAAKETQTGIRHSVDHIFPLDGKTFSGLNVPWNLQVITSFNNNSKRNKIPLEHKNLFWETDPSKLWSPS